MLDLEADRRSQLEEAQTRKTWCLPLDEQNYFRKIGPFHFHPRAAKYTLHLSPAGLPQLPICQLIDSSQCAYPPSKTLFPALPYKGFGLALLRIFKNIDFQLILAYLCSMTTRSRFCSCWGPKLKANLRARSLISMKAGSSFRPWGPCSCSSSVYNCVQETWYIWEMEEQGGNREIEHSLLCLEILKDFGCCHLHLLFLSSQTLSLLLTPAADGAFTPAL